MTKIIGVYKSSAQFYPLLHTVNNTEIQAELHHDSNAQVVGGQFEIHSLAGVNFPGMYGGRVDRASLERECCVSKHLSGEESKVGEGYKKKSLN